MQEHKTVLPHQHIFVFTFKIFSQVLIIFNFYKPSQEKLMQGGDLLLCCLPYLCSCRIHYLAHWEFSSLCPGSEQSGPRSEMYLPFTPPVIILLPVFHIIVFMSLKIANVNCMKTNKQINKWIELDKMLSKLNESKSLLWISIKANVIYSPL